MRARASGMWWGPTVEAPDPAALAGFYAGLLAWPLVHQEPGTAVVAAPGGAYLVFQQANGYQRPVWPPLPGAQRPMAHLDFQVADLQAAVSEAVAAGAVVADHQPQEHVRVLLDPVGHPFCLCWEQEQRTTSDDPGALVVDAVSAAPMSPAAPSGPPPVPADPTSTLIARAGERTGAPGAEGNPASWGDVEEALTAGGATTWLSLRAEDGVHTRPVFAAWTGTSFVVASKATAAKTRHLDAGAPCSLAVDLGSTHLVVEAVPTRLTEHQDLHRASAAFLAVFDWPTSVAGDELDAPYAAPTSGGPPFRVYELSPTRAFAFPTADQFEPTRFVF